MGGQQGPHRVAQQSGVMAGQGSDQQDLGIVAAGMADVAVKVHQAAERLVHHHAFGDADGLAIDLGGGEVPGRLLVFLADACHQLVPSRHLAGNRGVSERAVGAGKQLGAGVRESCERSQEGALHFVQLIQHVGKVLLGRACVPIIAPGTNDISKQPEETSTKKANMLLKNDPIPD
ncbi:hypothetical protein D9M68_699560 [compost metagenome]